MAMTKTKCPNCSSEFCSAIRFWKEKKTDFIDMYSCADCERSFDPATKTEMPNDWQPPRAKAQGQYDLYGKLDNIRDLIDPVPKMVETPTGEIVGVAHIPANSTQQYRDELTKMMRELNSKYRAKERPQWYKYRKIKRVK